MYDDYVVRENIIRFRRLLTTSLDEEQRQAIAALLEAEIRKLPKPARNRLDGPEAQIGG